MAGKTSDRTRLEIDSPRRRAAAPTSRRSDDVHLTSVIEFRGSWPGGC
jgi:hypothetical protein